MIEWYWVAATIPPGFIIGWSTAKIQKRNQPKDPDILKFMNRVVNQEEMEHHERLTKFRMARNGRKTQRFDSGPNAKMLRAKIRPVARRFR